MVEKEYQKRALAKIHSIEKEHNVIVLLAVESGSRAWGFASTDSDYDVRFIYRHPTQWYLDVLQRRDVIEYPIVDEMDYSGWDLRKALFLLNKSNPVLYEWFQSPIQYKVDSDFMNAMADPLLRYFSPIATMYHYLRMAENNYREYLKKEIVKTKKYFYVLRPLFACHWIENYSTAPPMEFQKVMEAANLRTEVFHHISSLLERKIAGQEFSEEPRLDSLNEYIETQIEHFQTVVQGYNPRKKPEPDYLNEFFASYLIDTGGNFG